MKIYPLSEGSFTIDKTKLFVPYDELKDNLQHRPKGSLLVEIQPFLIITKNDVLLLDCGLGYSDKEKRMQIHANLSSVGFNATDVTKVLLSHLHKDHAGGVSLDQDHQQLSFPGATYYVQERELNIAFEKSHPSYITEDFKVLKNSGQVMRLKDDAGKIDDYIEYKVTGAHSLFHQVFWIKEDDQVLFFGADDAPQLQQMKHRFVAKYDLDGKKAMELRQLWWETGKREGWTFLFYHDITTPIALMDANSANGR